MLAASFSNLALSTVVARNVAKKSQLARIIREKWCSDEFFIETKHVVTRAEFFFIHHLISKQLVRAKGRF
jgi:hypothetical protein